MNVTIKCKLNSRFPETVYADMYEGDELLVTATLGYCVTVANEHGHTPQSAAPAGVAEQEYRLCGRLK